MDLKQSTSQGFVLDPKKEQREFLNPDEILEEVGLTGQMSFADFGCGAGYFTIPAAKMVGDHGHIYAVDVLKDVLEDIRGKAKVEGLRNIKTIWADLEIPGSTKLPDHSVDMVFLSHVFYQSDKHSPILAEAARVVKPEGKIVLIEWRRVEAPFGPPLEARVSKKESIALAGEVGLHVDSEFKAGSYHYGLILKPGLVADAKPKVQKPTIKYE